MSDSNDDAKDPFLARWSRRKVAARRGEALPEPAAPNPPTAPAPPPTEASATAAAEPAPELPSLDTLKGLESEYQAFMRPDVDPATRTAALKKLFGDPHFNTMDGLDVYIDDYSIPDPIPAAMLKTLSAARTLGLFDDNDEKKKVAPASDTAAAPEPIPAPAGEPNESAPQPALDAPEPVDSPHKPEAA